MQSRSFTLLIVFAAGCATAQPNAVNAVLVLEPSVVRVDADPTVGLEVYDAELLFHLAGEAERNDENDRAVAIYRKLIAEFASSIYAHPARFNAGLVLEGLEHYRQAAALYEAVAHEARPTGAQAERTWIDAHYRLAVCQGKLGEWWEAVAVFEKLIVLETLSDEDRLEALVGQGIAMHEAGEPESADIQFSHALRFFRTVSRRRRFDDRGLAAEAAFRMGDIARERFLAVDLAYPVETLTERLEDKCEYLLSAQNRYLQAIRYGDSHTVAAAGFRIGNLYESLYEHMAGLDAPAELDSDQKAVYIEEVHTRIAILLEKAIKIYERSLVAAKRVDSAEAWAQRTEAALARLRAMYLADGASPRPEG